MKIAPREKRQHAAGREKNDSFFSPPEENFREQRTSEKAVSLFKRKSHWIPVLGLRGRLWVNGTDLYKWYTRFGDEIYQSRILLTIYLNREPIGLPM